MAATATPDLDTDSETRTQRQPPYAVVLHNDDINTMDFVVMVLRKVFGYTAEKCVGLMMEAHEKGRSVIWT
ncbi:ATP-dependent Clp protease adaptor ClpS, partial [Escherichia coli]|uniref:ATP-dependent Clp protease adaptor ClpS n=1 Tax=Escherichia coli TaxID=562 RepID=UPI0021D7EDAE